MSFRNGENMEVEVKYSVPSADILESIWGDKYLLDISDNSSSERLPFFAVYYDAPGLLLRHRGISLRVRSEGDGAFATIKWGGSSKNGLHVREEVNIPVSADSVCCPPDPALFAQTEKGEELKEITMGSSLEPVLTMKFTRSRRRLSYEGNIIELALDKGEMINAKGTVPIQEMELEHFAGPDRGSVKKLGDELAERFGLSPENRSKFSRGLELV